MLAEDSAQQVISQNLANAGTTGYKEEIPRFATFEENLIACSSDQGAPALGSMGNGTDMTGTFTDLSDGPLQNTGNNLDIALRGDAYLALQTNQGVMYSRDGALTLGADGALVQATSGLPILDANGRKITISGTPKSITIQPNGNVDADGRTAGTIALYAVTAEDSPTKMGGNLISTSVQPAVIDPTKTELPPIMSGFLEGSNVNIVQEMVTMIACTRAYEANAKTLQAHDETLEKAVSDVGKVT
jgi:flagellar basal-body rod protein FlgG